MVDIGMKSDIIVTAGKFLVLRGTKSVPSKILDDTEMITHEKGDFLFL